jgi:hypothetical protein
MLKNRFKLRNVTVFDDYDTKTPNQATKTQRAQQKAVNPVVK